MVPVGALITGGGRGIGRETARALAMAGHKVVVTGRVSSDLDVTVELIERQGGTAYAVPGDVSVCESARQVANAARRFVDTIDILVNNAGSPGQFVPVLDVDPARLVSTFATNVFGPFFMCQAVVPDMVARGHGYVVNMNSMQGSRAMPGASLYGSSKAALMRITDTLGQELAGTGVMLFDVSPGLVRTRMMETPGLAEVVAEFPDSEWMSAELAAGTICRLTSGAYDRLSGRFIHASDDLDELLALVEEDDVDARRLRLAAATLDDPLFT
jgi:NAD(P)-dependent dehydrogenase (short-subunit alcohol dehydrogenase family)